MKYKLLVIDDHISDRKVYYDQVLLADFEPVYVEYPSDLINSIQNINVDGYLVDIVLDNWELEKGKSLKLLDVLKIIGNTKPIILVSNLYVDIAKKNELLEILNELVNKGFRVAHFLNWDEFELGFDKIDNKTAVLNATVKIIMELNKFYTISGQTRFGNLDDKEFPEALTENEKEIARRTINVWSKVLSQDIQTRLIELINSNENKNQWYEPLIDKMLWKQFDSNYWNPVEIFSINKKIIKDQFEMNLGNYSSFYDFPNNLWTINQQILVTIGKTLSTNQELKRAGRLFLIHETLHISQHGMDANKTNNIGRFEKIIEDADFKADVYALLHEFRLYVIDGNYEKNDPNWQKSGVIEILNVMLKTMWSFDAGESKLKKIEVRRVNRYLIWYWMLAKIERADSFEEICEILSKKPIIQYSGAKLQTDNNRVYFDFTNATLGDEVAWIHNETIYRSDANAATQIRLGFSQRDEMQIKDAVSNLINS